MGYSVSMKISKIYPATEHEGKKGRYYRIGFDGMRLDTQTKISLSLFIDNPIEFKFKEGDEVSCNVTENVSGGKTYYNTKTKDIAMLCKSEDSDFVLPDKTQEQDEKQLRADRRACLAIASAKLIKLDDWEWDREFTGMARLMADDYMD